jgi:hypothetical protein
MPTLLQVEGQPPTDDALPGFHRELRRLARLLIRQWEDFLGLAEKSARRHASPRAAGTIHEHF